MSACSRELPEKDSADAALYVARCGGCHRAYHPGIMTPSMWKLQVDRMDGKFLAVHQPVPEGEERARLMAYLTRNAEK